MTFDHMISYLIFPSILNNQGFVIAKSNQIAKAEVFQTSISLL
jgi:hypothetical protein